MIYYKVITRFFDDGRVTAKKQVYRDLPEKPEHYSGSMINCDVYHDWFDVEEEADAFIAEAEAENG